MSACDSSNTPGLGLMEDGQVWPWGDLGVLATLIRIIRQDIRTASMFFVCCEIRLTAWGIIFSYSRQILSQKIALHYP